MCFISLGQLCAAMMLPEPVSPITTALGVSLLPLCVALRYNKSISRAVRSLNTTQVYSCSSTFSGLILLTWVSLGQLHAAIDVYAETIVPEHVSPITRSLGFSLLPLCAALQYSRSRSRAVYPSF